MSDAAPRPTPRRIWRLLGGAVTAILFVMLAPVALWQAAFAVTVGWIPFLRSTVPRMTVDWPQVWLTLAALAVFVAGLHRCLRWLLRNAAAVEAPGWRLRWTAAVATIVLFMFVAGTAMVGIAHQAAWLARSDEPWTQSSFREALRRSASMNNLKQIGLAASGHERKRGVLPNATMCDADGRPLHGWMTVLLPFVEQGELFARVRLDEPWDSAANAPVFATRVKAYENPGIPRDGQAAAPVLADYAANALVIGPGEPMSSGRIDDGVARTILAGEVTAGRAPWGRPGNCRDPRRGIDAASPDAFGGPGGNGLTGLLFADGHVEFVGRDIDLRVLEALATPAGGESIPEY